MDRAFERKSRRVQMMAERWRLVRDESLEDARVNAQGGPVPGKVPGQANVHEATAKSGVSFQKPVVSTNRSRALRSSCRLVE